jgi:Ca-activated chloride channel homolog
MLVLFFLGASACFGQSQAPPPTPPAAAVPGQQQWQLQKPQDRKQGKPFTLKRDVDLVRMQVSVVDKKGTFVPELKAPNFRVWENGVPQIIAAFTGEDIPISVGLVVDNSASMKSKRPRVNEAALDFVKTSNPQDEVFVVNFNDEYYLDMDTDFTNDQNVLKAALERIDSRGGTALYDAILGSISHLRKGTKDKRVLLVVTDGEDRDSQNTLDETVQKAQQSNTMIYAVGLYTKGDDSPGEIRGGEKALKALTQATGGEVFFPKTIEEVDQICQRIAQDIREQYTIGYYPTNTAKDGTFRSVKVELADVKGFGKLLIRTRPGYYAPQEASAAAAK